MLRQLDVVYQVRTSPVSRPAIDVTLCVDFMPAASAVERLRQFLSLGYAGPCGRDTRHTPKILRVWYVK